MSDALEQNPSYRCAVCNETRSGAARVLTPVGPVCDACEWLQTIRETEGPHDPKWLEPKGAAE